jgi:uncharacterized membrane protein
VKRYLIAGLVIWIPLVITLWVLRGIVTTMDELVTPLMPGDWRPETWLGIAIPGTGLIVTAVVVVVTGVLASNLIGQRLVQGWESLLARIPIVKSLYGGVKQVSDTLFSPGGQAFRKAVLLQYPRAGTWTIGFQAGVPGGELASTLGDDMISVYVPTTPNPTSGFLLMVSRSDVRELQMSVDEALKYVISMGVVGPELVEAQAPAQGADQTIRS